MEKILANAEIRFSPFLILASDNGFSSPPNGAQNTAAADFLICSATKSSSLPHRCWESAAALRPSSQLQLRSSTKRVRDAEKYSLLLCFAFTTVMFIVTRFLPVHFIRLFTSNAEISRLSVWAIGVFTFAIIPLSLQYVLVDGLTAMERTKTALSLSLFRKSFYVVLVFILPLNEETTVFYAQPIADLTASTVSTIVFLLVFRKHMERREAVFRESSKRTAI